MLDGQAMRTPMDLPLQCRIMVVSKTEEFSGLAGLEHFDSHAAATRQNVGGATYVNTNRPTIKVKPQPETWVHMAQVKWVRNNATDKIPSYSDGGPNDSETQNKIIEAIQEEQNRVHLQDQRLLRKLDGAPTEENMDDVKHQGADGDEAATLKTSEAEPVDEEEEEEYEHKKLEDDIIKYICEKIVAMREQPFIDAVDNLRRAQELNNLQMIMDMQKNKQKLSNNLNYHTANLGAGYGLGAGSQKSGQTPVDGMSQA